MKPPRINTGKTHLQLSIKLALIKWNPEVLNKHEPFSLIREEPKHLTSDFCQPVNGGWANRQMTAHRCDTVKVPMLNFFQIQWWNLAAVKKNQNNNNHAAAAALRVWQTDALPLAVASEQTRTSRRMCRLPVTVCQPDGRWAVLFVDRLFLPDPHLSPPPTCISRNGGQTERGLSFQTTVPCKQSMSPCPNTRSQLAWVTYIPNYRVHVCM